MQTLQQELYGVNMSSKDVHLLPTRFKSCQGNVSCRRTFVADERRSAMTTAHDIRRARLVKVAEGKISVVSSVTLGEPGDSGILFLPVNGTKNRRDNIEKT